MAISWNESLGDNSITMSKTVEMIKIPSLGGRSQDTDIVIESEPIPVPNKPNKNQSVNKHWKSFTSCSAQRKNRRCNQHDKICHR
jgi:hypothetical protein